MHVRRVDSAFGLDDNNETKQSDDETVIAVKLMEVRCRVGPSSEPHGVEDIGYEWSYHALEDSDLQLSIGLGDVLRADELLAITGAQEEEFEELRGRRGYEQYDDEDDGIGGF